MNIALLRLMPFNVESKKYDMHVNQVFIDKIFISKHTHFSCNVHAHNNEDTSSKTNAHGTYV